VTWYYGLPASSSHALVGGLAGAAIAAEGLSALVASGVWKIAAFIVISSLLGMLLGVTLMNLVMFVAQFVMSHGWGTLRGLNWVFRKLQLASAAAYSLGHGANDAQKTMGVIAAVILIDKSAPVEDFEISLPIVLAAHTAIALGTLSGGWRIVHTLGSKITKLQPWVASRRRPGLQSPCSERRRSVSRFRPLTRSPVRSSASELPTVFPPFGGGLRAEWCGPGY
jgi:inorganic phosphate transporter, PiT family